MEAGNLHLAATCAAQNAGGSVSCPKAEVRAPEPEPGPADFVHDARPGRAKPLAKGLRVGQSGAPAAGFAAGVQCRQSANLEP